MKTQNPVPATPATITPSRPGFGPFDHQIELDEAKELIVRHKRAYPAERAATAFSRVALDRILAQPGCEGIRMYYALNPDGTRTLVLVGVDAEGREMGHGELAEKGYPCPPVCDMFSILDS